MSKNTYVVDQNEIEEIKKEVAVTGLKAKREWKELDEMDIITMTNKMNNFNDPKVEKVQTRVRGNFSAKEDQLSFLKSKPKGGKEIELTHYKA